MAVRIRRRAAMPRRTAVMMGAVLAAAGLASCADSAAAPGSSVEGSWGNTADSSSPSLDFDSGGRFSGTDGCNDLTGGWDQNGSTVDMKDTTSTAVGCPDLEDGGDWLSAAAAAEVDGEVLELFNSHGDPIGTLQR